MNKNDLVREIKVSLRRLSLYLSEETEEFLWDLSEEQLVLVLKFCSRLSKFYSKKG